MNYKKIIHNKLYSCFVKIILLMLIKWRVPKTIQWIVKLFFIYLFIFTVFRIATVFFFKPKNLSVIELLPSFWLGLKYDLRWIAFILSPIVFLSLFLKLSPFYSHKNKKIWTISLGIIVINKYNYFIILPKK